MHFFILIYFSGGKTFSFKNINKSSKGKIEEESEKNKINIFKNKEESLFESDKESASFRGDESLKEKIVMPSEKPKDEIYNKNLLFFSKEREGEKKSILDLSNNTNISFGTKNVEQQKLKTNFSGNEIKDNVNEKVKEIRPEFKINEVIKPSIFEKKGEESNKPQEIKGTENKVNLFSMNGVTDNKEKVINLPINNNLFGNQNSKFSNDQSIFENKDKKIVLFEPNNEEKKGLFGLANPEKNETSSTTPIFNQLTKKVELVQKEKLIEPNNIFGDPAKNNISNNFSTSNLFDGSNIIKQSDTPLASDNNNLDKKVENNERKNENSESLTSKLSVPSEKTREEQNTFISKNTLFGNGTYLFGKTETKSEIIDLTENEEKSDMKTIPEKNELVSSKFGENDSKQEKNNELKTNLTFKNFAKKDDETKTEFSLFNKSNNDIKESSINNTSSIFSLKPSIPAGSSLFQQNNKPDYTDKKSMQVPNLFGLANNNNLFGKPTEILNKTEGNNTTLVNKTEKSEKTENKIIVESEKSAKEKENVEDGKSEIFNKNNTSLFDNSKIFSSNSNIFGENKPKAILTPNINETQNTNGKLFGEASSIYNL